MVDHVTEKYSELPTKDPLKFTEASKAFKKTPGSARTRPDAQLTPHNMEAELHEGLVQGVWGHKFVQGNVAASELLHDGIIPCLGIRLPEGGNRKVVNIDTSNRGATHKAWNWPTILQKASGT